jgi:hypothetical protein
MGERIRARKTSGKERAAVRLKRLYAVAVGDKYNKMEQTGLR